MWVLYVLGGIVVLVVIFVTKNMVWDESQKKISGLRKDMERLLQLHKDEMNNVYARLENNSDVNVHLVDSELADIIVNTAWREISVLCNEKYDFLGIPPYNSSITMNEKIVKERTKERFLDAIDAQYKYRYIAYLYPELESLFSGVRINTSVSINTGDVGVRVENLFDIINILRKNSKVTNEIVVLKNRIKFLEASTSNLKAIPYMAHIMADYETYGLERLAERLNWGYSSQRLDKVKSIREIRKDALAIVEKNKESQYQLAYLLDLFPNLKDVIECEFKQLPIIEVSEISDYDYSRDYISKEEYATLSVVERNQLALDRYKKYQNKTKWQIGRDYELYVGYKYSQNGYDVDYYGSYMGLEDLGRDLIAKKDNKTLIIQCKYWSSIKEIHENHITQLYGTMISYCIENNVDKVQVEGILITNIRLSDMAKQMANYLGVKFEEGFKVSDYPCIKCNIGHDEYGKTKIYHLPFDQQYDSAKIKYEGEFYAMTVAEAENAGFRRAFKWFGTNS